MVYTEPAMTPPMPVWPGAECRAVNTDTVLADPARTMSIAASTTNTSTSKAPRTVPRRALVCTPRYPAAPTMSAPSSAQGHHRSAG